MTPNPYVTYQEVVLGHDAFTRAPLDDKEDVVRGIIEEATSKTEADLCGYLDVVMVRERVPINPIVKSLVIAKARERIYAAVYGSNLPEDGGQVARWKREYDAALADVVSGKYERVFGNAVLYPREFGTVEAV